MTGKETVLQLSREQKRARVERPARSWLYVPGHRSDMVAKALASEADAVVVDLQDAVPPEAKDAARAAVSQFADLRPQDGSGPQVWVRINDPGAEKWLEKDLAEAGGWQVDGLRIPRAEDAKQIKEILDGIGLPAQLLIETAHGLVNAAALAAAHPLVVGIGLGETDLAADLGVRTDSGLEWARGLIVATARAAGLAPPIQSVYTNVADIEGLRATTRSAFDNGFFGRSVIHPRQVPVVNEVFTPSAAEVEQAQRLVSFYQSALNQGSSAILDERGRFVDPAVVERARNTLRIASLFPIG